MQLTSLESQDKSKAIAIIFFRQKKEKRMIPPGFEPGTSSHINKIKLINKLNKVNNNRYPYHRLSSIISGSWDYRLFAVEGVICFFQTAYEPSNAVVVIDCFSLLRFLIPLMTRSLRMGSFLRW